MSLDLTTPLGSVLASIVDAGVRLGVPGAVATADGSGDTLGPVDGAPVGEAAGGVETAQRFLFSLPDEVKTILMVVLAIAIGVYLYLNFLNDRP